MFLSQLPLQSFSGPLETHYTYQIDSQREIVLEETPSFPAILLRDGFFQAIFPQNL